MSNRILLIGGGGYVGSALTPQLLSLGYIVTVFDLFMYGEALLSEHPNLTLIKGDVRHLSDLECCMREQDAVIHLACVSNDPSFELDPRLGKSINFDCFEDCVRLAISSGIKRFIYASSSSVYGIKAEKDVTETMSLEPLTDYSKFKADCENVLLKYRDELCVTIIRPATVCGFSPRLRLDVVVNILANLAWHTGKIKVFGGSQLRPNIHIKDMVDVYVKVLEAGQKEISGETFNAGSENLSVIEIANIVRDTVGNDTQISREPTDDHRSYHVSSAKIQDVLGFKFRFGVRDAVNDLVYAFEHGLVNDPMNNPVYSNIQQMKRLNLS